jgi:5-methylcytosine-specific restriction protein A
MSDAIAALAEIKPRRRSLVIELVRDAGVDVTDWANFRGGPTRAAMNPKYCYEWAFVEPGKVVVLSLWFESMRTQGLKIYQELNMRRRADASAKASGAAMWRTRSLRFDGAVRTAYEQQLPIRVIVCDGQMRPTGDEEASASKVEKRMLDPVPWAVAAYDWSNCGFRLERDIRPPEPIDMAVDDELEGFEGEVRSRFVRHRSREAKMRGRKIADSLRRNGGHLVCEVPNCGFDFKERYGELGSGYAQVHHKVPLSRAPERGRQVRLDDLAVVCANCHAMIHKGGECRPMDSLIKSKVRPT